MPLTMAMAARLMRMPGWSYMQWWQLECDDDDRGDNMLDDNDDPIEKNEPIFKGKLMLSKPTDVVDLLE